MFLRFLKTTLYLSQTLGSIEIIYYESKNVLSRAYGTFFSTFLKFGGAKV